MAPAAATILSATSEASCIQNSQWSGASSAALLNCLPLQNPGPPTKCSLTLSSLAETV